MATATAPIITFKAGLCDLDENSKPYKVVPKTTPGYIFLYKDVDGLPHFCWRPRSVPLNRPTLDLIMLPGDGTFKPYERRSTASNSKPLTNGRIFVLKFLSSSSRHLFWLQSKNQHATGDESWFSPRDLKLGHIVDQLIQGEDVNVEQEIANLPSDRDQDDDDDAEMQDADASAFGADLQQAVSGGAGADATGGDVRDEGEESREGGADGGRAAAPCHTDAQAAVANFLKSLQGKELGNQQSPRGKEFTTLPDLLQPSSTLLIVNDASESYINGLLSYLPPILILLAHEVYDSSAGEASSETIQEALEALSLGQKKDILRKVLRSPQFSQSLASLTMALHEGGLPTISDALKIKVENGGYVPGGTIPRGAGDAIEAFLTGIKTSIEDQLSKEHDDGKMDTE